MLDELVGEPDPLSFVDVDQASVVQGSEDNDELVVADLDLNMIDQVRATWQFFRDRRPDAYDEIVEP